MSQKYLSEYDRLCLRATVEEIQAIHPNLSREQIIKDIEEIKAQDTEWGRASVRRHLKKIKAFIWGDK